jgi:hypothetical protein
MNDFPQPNGVWSRIERAREALGWTDSELSERALGARTHYSLLKKRGFKAHEKTLEKIIHCLEQVGYSGTWLRAGVLPERADGAPMPERAKVVTQLARLASKLGLSAEQVMGLWVDLDAEGPLQRYPEELQRAAFAAAYLENRTLEDVRIAVEQARSSPSWSTGIDDMLMAIRIALRAMKRGGSGTLLSIRPPSRAK